MIPEKTGMPNQSVLTALRNWKPLNAQAQFAAKPSKRKITSRAQMRDRIAEPEKQVEGLQLQVFTFEQERIQGYTLDFGTAMGVPILGTVGI